jgi:hypothetical protein
MANSVERLLEAAPWLGKGAKPRPANTNAQKGKSKAAAKPAPRRGGRVVTERQFQDAQRLKALYGYVISVDDALVLADHERSPLVIGEGNGYPPANDNQKDNRKGKKPVTLVNGLIPEGKTA